MSPDATDRWEPHDELDKGGCAYGWRNRQFIQNLQKNSSIILAVAGLLLTGLMAITLMTRAEAREATGAVSELRTDTAKQQAILESWTSRLGRMEDKLDKVIERRP
jgi:hypothetical protein